MKELKELKELKVMWKIVKGTRRDTLGSSERFPWEGQGVGSRGTRLLALDAGLLGKLAVGNWQNLKILLQLAIGLQNCRIAEYRFNERSA